jgi:hypothetical protein
MSNEVFYQLSADKLVALTAYGEAASEGAQGLMAVINVIANRTRDPNQFADQNILASTGSVYHAVILKEGQFSVYNASDPQRPKMIQIAQNFDSYANTNKVLNQAYQLSQMLFLGTLEDNTGGATHYHATYVSPSWAATIPFVGQIGNHLFYSVYPIWKRAREITTTLAASPWTYIIGFSLIGILIYLYKRRKQ